MNPRFTHRSKVARSEMARRKAQGIADLARERAEAEIQRRSDVMARPQPGRDLVEGAGVLSPDAEGADGRPGREGGACDA